MPNASSDVVVIGGGLIGLALAYQLALQQLSVALLEKGQIGQEASAAGAGILSPQAEMEEMSPLTELCLSGRDMFADFIQEIISRTGVDVEFSISGLLYAALSEEAEKELEQRHDWQSACGLPCQKLSRSAALELENRLNPEVLSALFFPKEAYVDNVRLLEALRVACVQLRVRLVTGCQAITLKTEGSKVAGVHTNLGLWPAGKVIIAAGSWSSLVGTSLPYAIPIRPARGQMVVIKAPAPILKHVVYSSRGYLVPRRDGRMLSGSTVELVGYDKSVTLEGLHQILTGALGLFPVLRSFTFLTCWAGLRPYCEDGLPVLGATEIEGLYFATGHFRNGLLLAPVTAKLMTELVLSGKTTRFMEPFSPTRFNRS
jgi:glycine oxidase